MGVPLFLICECATENVNLCFGPIFPYMDRTNLTVLTNALVIRVPFEE